MSGTKDEENVFLAAFHSRPRPSLKMGKKHRKTTNIRKLLKKKLVGAPTQPEASRHQRTDSATADVRDESDSSDQPPLKKSNVVEASDAGQRDDPPDDSSKVVEELQQQDLQQKQTATTTQEECAAHAERDTIVADEVKKLGKLAEASQELAAEQAAMNKVQQDEGSAMDENVDDGNDATEDRRNVTEATQHHPQNVDDQAQDCGQPSCKPKTKNNVQQVASMDENVNDGNDATEDRCNVSEAKQLRPQTVDDQAQDTDQSSSKPKKKRKNKNKKKHHDVEEATAAGKPSNFGPGSSHGESPQKVPTAEPPAQKATPTGSKEGRPVECWEELAAEGHDLKIKKMKQEDSAKTKNGKPKEAATTIQQKQNGGSMSLDRIASLRRSCLMEIELTVVNIREKAGIAFSPRFLATVKSHLAEAEKILRPADRREIQSGYPVLVRRGGCLLRATLLGFNHASRLWAYGFDDVYGGVEHTAELFERSSAALMTCEKAVFALQLIQGGYLPANNETATFVVQDMFDPPRRGHNQQRQQIALQQPPRKTLKGIFLAPGSSPAAPAAAGPLPRKPIIPIVQIRLPGGAGLRTPSVVGRPSEVINQNSAAKDIQNNNTAATAATAATDKDRQVPHGSSTSASTTPAEPAASAAGTVAVVPGGDDREDDHCDLDQSPSKDDKKPHPDRSNKKDNSTTKKKNQKQKKKKSPPVVA